MSRRQQRRLFDHVRLQRHHLKRARDAAWPLLSLVAFSLGGSVAHADAPAGAGARLEWSADEASGCMSRAELVTAVTAILARTPFAATELETDRIVRGRVARQSDGRYVAVVTLERLDGSVVGTRRVDTREASCHALDASLAIVVALLADTPAAELAVHPGADAPAVEPPRTTLPPRAHLTFELDARGATGLVGALSGGAGLVFSLEPSARFALELGASTTYGSPAAGLGRAELLAYEASLGACLLPVVSDRVRVRTCLGARAGALHASASGFDVSYSETRPLGSAAAWARLVANLGAGLGLCVELGLGAPWVRDRFVFADAGGTHSLHRAAAVYGVLGLGLEYRMSL